MSGTALATLLEAPGATPRPLDLAGYRIEGDVDLRGRPVRRLFRCRACRLGGDFSASGVVFARTVDLTGATIQGKLQLVGATFGRDLLARGATFEGTVDARDAHVVGNLDMEGASFRAAALFGFSGSAQGADKSAGSYDGNVDFALSEFEQLVTFEDAFFTGSSDFTWVRFDRDAVFAGGESDGPTVFRRSAFAGTADFSGRILAGRTDFSATQFRGDADFSQTEFDEPVVFSGARFSAGGSFLGADFESSDPPAKSAEKKSPPPPPSSSFEGVRVEGTLDFSLATFRRPANFSQMSTSGLLSFDQAELHVPRGLNFFQVSLGSLQLGVPDALAAVKGSDKQREHVLDLIESSAKERNDLGLANDAHYERQVIRSRNYTPPLHVLDVVFYRTFAGYFVRPLNPLVTLLVAAALFSFYRALPAYRPAAGEPRRALRRLGSRLHLLFRRDVKAGRHFISGFFDALAAIGPRRGDAAAGPPWRLEVVGYRLLLTCALIGLANANPTLRQMFNAFG
jgi:hypothetical protein